MYMRASCGATANGTAAVCESNKNVICRRSIQNRGWKRRMHAYNESIPCVFPSYTYRYMLVENVEKFNMDALVWASQPNTNDRDATILFVNFVDQSRKFMSDSVHDFILVHNVADLKTFRFHFYLNAESVQTLCYCVWCWLFCWCCNSPFGWHTSCSVLNDWWNYQNLI